MSERLDRTCTGADSSIRAPYAVRMTMAAQSARKGVAYALLAAALFGVNGSISKVVMASGVTAQQLTWVRTTATFVIAGLYVVLFQRAGLRVTWRQLAAYAVLGLAGLAMVQWLYSVAIRELHVGVALLFEYTAVIIVALVATFVFKERVHRRIWISIALVLGGLAVVAEVWDSSLSPLGVTAGLGAALAFAWYFLGGERLMAHTHPVTASFWAAAFACALWTALSGWWRIDPGAVGASLSLSGSLSGIHVPLWGALLWIAVLGGFVPFMLIFTAMRHVSATMAGLIATSEVIFAFAVAWAWLGEVLSTVHIVGAGLACVGIAIGQTARVEPTETVAGPGGSPGVPTVPDAATPDEND